MARRSGPQEAPQTASEAGALHAVTLAELDRLQAVQTPLGQLALILATSLDAGAGMATAAVAKELRATLKELTPDDGGDDFTRFMESLSSSVRDPASS